MKQPDCFQVAVAFDNLINTLFDGWKDERIGSCTHRKRMRGNTWLSRLIDGIFFWQKEHCLNAYKSELERAHLPISMRGKINV